MTQKALPTFQTGVSQTSWREQARRAHPASHVCSKVLAMNNAPMKAIQELAGHADLSTTMRYMHLSPASRDGAIKLLERGNNGEAGISAMASS